MRKTICFLLILGLLLPLIPAAAEPLTDQIGLSILEGQDSSLPQSEDRPQAIFEDSYVLGSGDQLEAHLIVGENALSLDYKFTINPEGKIFFPNITEINLSGLTLGEAKTKITKEINRKYQEKYILFLTVIIPKKISIYITGQVDMPGMLTVFDGTRIANVLKKAGVAKRGSTLIEDIYLKRKNAKGELTDYKLSLYNIFSQNNGSDNMLLKSGDIISVPAIKSYVYVYGEVAKSGTYGYVPGQTIADYINTAGGPTERASLGSVTVSRVENGNPRVFHIDVSEILNRGMKQKDIEILAGDVINVPGNFFYFSDFASFVNTILLALTLYSTVVR